MQIGKVAQLAAVSIVTVIASSVLVRLIRADSTRPKAFTIHYVETMVSRPPLDSYYSQKTDGSKVISRMMQFPDRKSYLQKTVFDVQAGTKGVVDEATQSKTTYRLSKSAITDLTKAPNTCTSDAAAQRGTILGHTVVRTQSEIPSSNHRIVEDWHAPISGVSYYGEVVSGIGADGNPTELVRKEAVSVAIGDPDATLFEVPDWAERSPSDVMAEYSRRYNRPLPPPEGMVSQDRAYHTIPQQ